MKTILILYFVNFIIHLVEDCCRVGAKIRVPNQVVFIVFGSFVKHCMYMKKKISSLNAKSGGKDNL